MAKILPSICYNYPKESTLRELLLAAHDTFREKDVTATEVVKEISPHLVCSGVRGTMRDGAARRAALSVASIIDSDPNHRLPQYHNVAHYLDVALTAFSIARIERQNPSSILRDMDLRLGACDPDLCLIAGLAHDVGHPGGDNGGVAFALEQNSWQLIEKTLLEAGYDRRSLVCIKLMILGTDPTVGVPAIRSVLFYHLTEGKALQDNFVQQLDGMREEHQNPLLNKLISTCIEDPALGVMCSILNEADVFFFKMPETYLSCIRSLHDERINTGVPVPLLDESRVPLIRNGAFFLKNIALADEAHLLESIQKVEGDAPKNALKMLTNGEFVGEEPETPTFWGNQSRNLLSLLTLQ